MKNENFNVQLMDNLRKMIAKISNNSIPEKNTSTMTTLSPIPETCPEETVGTKAEAVEVIRCGIIDTVQTTTEKTTISQIPTKTFPANNRSNNSTEISNPNKGNETTEILLQIIISK